MQRSENGFTLIELMVVVLIIAILIAIVMPIFNRVRNQSWKTSCTATLRTLDGQINTFLVSEGSYPDDFGSDTGESLNDGHPLVIENYLKGAPACPRAIAENMADNPPLPADGSGRESYLIIKASAELTAGAVYRGKCEFFNDDDNPHRY